MLRMLASLARALAVVRHVILAVVGVLLLAVRLCGVALLASRGIVAGLGVSLLLLLLVLLLLLSVRIRRGCRLSVTRSGGGGGWLGSSTRRGLLSVVSSPCGFILLLRLLRGRRSNRLSCRSSLLCLLLLLLCLLGIVSAVVWSRRSGSRLLGLAVRRLLLLRVVLAVVHRRRWGCRRLRCGGGGLRVLSGSCLGLPSRRRLLSGSLLSVVCAVVMLLLLLLRLLCRVGWLSSLGLCVLPVRRRGSCLRRGSRLGGVGRLLGISLRAVRGGSSSRLVAVLMLLSVLSVRRLLVVLTILAGCRSGRRGGGWSSRRLR
mmetsp:Transcript_30468/g.58641  ORF Transcript_30468/g.58641 Transcript_30468/m.58641 type:complete len:316 (-) Transcript_30468:2146-3093(-)